MRLQALLVTSILVSAGATHAADPGAILDANHAASGGAAWTGKGSLALAYAYSGQGMTGTVNTRYDLASGAFVDSFETEVIDGANGFDGQAAWMRDTSGAVTPEAGGDLAPLGVNEAYRDANLWWRAGRGGAEVRDLGVKTDAGQAYDALEVTPKGGKPFEAWFDPATHLLARTVEQQGPQTFTTFLSDYRSVDGVKLAGKLVIDDGTGEQYRTTQTLTEAHFGPVEPASTYAAPHVTLTDARIDNPAGETTVPFQLLNNHIYAEVKVNGKGPFLCIFDTGGHDILTPDTAKALAVKSEGAAGGTGAGEGVVDVGFAKNVTFQIGDLEIHNKAVTVLSFGPDAVEGFKEQGMVGFEVFRRFVTRIDYGAKTLTFIDPAKFDPRDAGTPIPFVFYNHLPQVDAVFEGIPGRYDVDTGSRVELTLTKPFVDANGLIAKHPKGVVAVDGWGVGGRAVSYMTRSQGFSIGPVKIDGVIASFGTQGKGAFADPNYQGNIGTALLKRFVVTFDYGHQVMYLKPITPTPPDIGTFDRAGFWINTSANGFKIVDLTAHGPAAAAGLKTDDEITAVDSAPATAIALSDLRRRLRDAPVGTVVRLTVESGGQTRVVPLTLQDQI